MKAKIYNTEWMIDTKAQKEEDRAIVSAYKSLIHDKQPQWLTRVNSLQSSIKSLAQSANL